MVRPSRTWFGTKLAAGAAHYLVGCTVAPGFDFADFELAEPELNRVIRGSRGSDPPAVRRPGWG